MGGADALARKYLAGGRPPVSAPYPGPPQFNPAFQPSSGRYPTTKCARPSICRRRYARSGERGAQLLDLGFHRARWQALLAARVARLIDQKIEMDNARLQAKRYRDEVAQTPRQADENILVGHDALLRQTNPAFFGGGLGAAQFAFVDGALEEQPGGNLHEPCRQTHAFDRIGDRRRARQELRLLAAIAVEIGGRPAHQIHPLLEKSHELFGRRQLLAEGDGFIVSKIRRLNHHAPFLPEADRSGIAGKQSPQAAIFFTS